MIMKVVKEELSKILVRAEITESSQYLSVKKRKRGVFILKSGPVQRLIAMDVYVAELTQYQSYGVLAYYFLHIFNKIFQFMSFSY